MLRFLEFGATCGTEEATRWRITITRNRLEFPTSLIVSKLARALCRYVAEYPAFKIHSNHKLKADMETDP